MVLNLNLLAAIVGCLVLVLFWLCHMRSGLRGLGLTLLGCVTIYAIYRSAGDMMSMIGSIVLVQLAACLLVVVCAVVRARRRNTIAIYVPLDQRTSPERATRKVAKR